MAKKKKSTSTGAEAAPTTPAAAGASGPPAAGPAAADVAYARGNYAALRHLATAPDGAHAQTLLSRVALDPVQVMVGVGALLVVLFAAALTLK